MRIGLIDVDGHNFPNLPLMKLSAWHKAQGDSVEFVIPMLQYDRVYMSKVFTHSKDFNTALDAKEVIKGGTGYSIKGSLLPEIEHTYPDYSLYGITNTAYGFLTRGCPRDCHFCIVTKKEGRRSHKVANMGEFYSGEKYLELLDPNLLAARGHIRLLKQLVKACSDHNTIININQGLDARLLNDHNTHYLKQLKASTIHFAWDNIEDEKHIIPKLTKFKKVTQFNERKLKVYVLTNYNTTHEQDLYRVYKLREMGYDPYIMIYKKHTAPHVTRRLQRYVNNKFVFRSCPDFAEYDPRGA